MAQHCPNMKRCPMFELFTLPGTLAAFKINYCTAEYERCKRYELVNEGKPVPKNLMPNGALLRKSLPDTEES